MDNNIVDDAELLYRSIRSNNDEFRIENGVAVFSSKAFDDRSGRPSVDRSALCIRADYAKKSATDGVVAIGAQSIRAIKVFTDPNPAGIGTTLYAVDVCYRPLVNDPTNYAHCQIECDPTFRSKTHFKKLKEALAQLANRAGFEISPQP